MADLQPVHDTLRDTLQADMQRRQAAEEVLKQWERTKGHVVALFRLAADVSLTIEPSLRQASAIRMKTIISRGWEPKTPGVSSHIDEEDKAVVRNNLVESLVFAPPLVRTQLSLCLRAIANADYPAGWPTLIPTIVEQLNRAEPQRVYGALLSLRTLTKSYEYKRDELRSPLYAICDQTFHIVLRLLQQLIPSNTVPASELTLLGLKIFWSSMQIMLPPYLLDLSNLQQWMDLLLQLVALPLPPDAPTDLDTAIKWGPWKVKKRVLQIFHRMLQRYGNPSAKHRSAPQSEALVAFARHFQDHYAARCLMASLSILQLRPAGQICPDRVVTLSLNFVLEAIKFKQTYAALKPQVQQLIFGIVFPLLCFNLRDHTLWEEDAVEYVRKEFDVMEDFYSPRTAATNVLLDLTKSRAKDCLHATVTFCAQVLSEAQQEPSTERLYRKDGALLALGSMHERLFKKTDYRASLEQMITLHVMPELDSAHGFMRLRACWTLGMFAQSLYAGGKSASSLAEPFRKILVCMGDRELPVRVQAALAINNIVESDCANEAVLSVLPDLVRALFGLMKDIGNDEVVQTLDNLIEKFGDQMAPYAVEVVQALVQHFLRLFEEQNDDDDDDCALAAMGVMQAISTMMQAVHTKPEMYPLMETALLPLLQRTMSDDASDFFEDTLEVLSFLTYYSATISDAVFSLLPRLVEAVHNWAWEYSNNFLAPVDNLISRATDTFLYSQNGAYIQMVLDMATCVLLTHHDSMPDFEAQGAVKMLESLLHNCRGRIDAQLPVILGLMLRRLEKTKPNSAIRTLLFDVLSGSLHYNARLTLQLIAAHGENAIPSALGGWITHLSSSNRLRPHDLKVAILAISALLELPVAESPPMLSTNRLLLVRGGAKLLGQLQGERERREAQAAQSEGDDDDGDDDGDGEEELDDDDDGSDDDAHEAALKLLTSRAVHDMSADDFEDDDLEDEVLYSSPLDDVDEHITFATACHAALNDSPQLLPLLGLAPSPSPELRAQLSAEETQSLHQLLLAGVAKAKAVNMQGAPAGDGLLQPVAQ